MESSNVLKYQTLILKLLGIYSTPESSCLFKLWGYLVIIWSGPILNCCETISVIYARNSNQLIDEILFMLTTSTIPMKVALLNSHLHNLFRLLEILKKLDKRIENPDERSAIRHVFTRCRRVTTPFFCMYMSKMTSVVAQLAVLPREERTWKSTYLIPSDFAQKPSVYYSDLFLQGFGNLLNVLLAVSIDTYCFVLLGLLAGHIWLFSMDVSRIGDSNGVRKNKSRSEHLKKILERYNLLINYSVELNKSLSRIFFVQVSVSAPIICTCAYQSARAQNLTSTQVSFLFFYAVGMLLQIFVPNYLAEDILEKCNLLPKNAFCSKWYELKGIDKKALQLFITRSNHPLLVTAGDFYEMNINTFLKITKTAYSLLAVLNSTQH